MRLGFVGTGAYSTSTTSKRSPSHADTIVSDEMCDAQANVAGRIGGGNGLDGVRRGTWDATFEAEPLNKHLGLHRTPAVHLSHSIGPRCPW